MKYKKNKGSSLVLVIGITAIIMIIGTILSSSILNTTRLNEDKKTTEDLVYAAESGIENALSHIILKKAENSSWEPKEDEKIIISKEEFDSNNIKIEVDIDKKDPEGINKYYLISKAKKENGKEEVVKATIGQQIGGNNIFENVICTNSSNIKAGAFNGMEGYVNIVEKENFEGGSTDKKGTSSPFIIPDYNFESFDENDKNIKVKDINELLLKFDDMDKKGVRKIELNTKLNTKFKVYLVNSDILNVEFSSPNMSLDNFIIISNGELNFKFTGNMHLVRSSIISKSLKIESPKEGIALGSISFNYPPFMDPKNFGGHSQMAPLDENLVKELNKKIKSYAPNWSNESTGSVDTNYWGTIEYEY